MIKLLPLLLESTSGRVTPLKGSLPDFLRKNCAVALDKARRNHMLFRGDSFPPEPVVIDPTASRRRSVSFSNSYMMYMETSPYWKKFPSRSYSLICGKEHTAEQFGGDEIRSGTLFRVFPTGNPSFAVCEYDDFVDGETDMPVSGNYNSTLLEFSDRLSIIFGNDIDDPQAFKELLFKLIDNSRRGEGWAIHNFIRAMVAELKKAPTKRDALKKFYSWMTPETTKTKLMKYSDMGYEFGECWTEGKCLLIPNEICQITDWNKIVISKPSTG